MTPEQQALLHDLYIENHASMLAYARVRSGNLDDAEDAVQETFRIACGRIVVVQESPNRVGWLMQALKFVLRKQQEAKKNALILPDDAEMLAAVADPHAASQLHTAEYAALLGDEDYKILDRSVLQKASSKELAAELGIKDDNCRKRLERVRTRLRRLVGGDVKERRL